jgi:hypothetical protein
LGTPNKKQALRPQGLYDFNLSAGVYAYLFLVAAFALKFNIPRRKSKQRIIVASAYVVARVNFRPPLADKYISCEHKLTVPALYAETLALAVSSVSGTSDTLFMCHIICTSLSL